MTQKLNFKPKVLALARATQFNFFDFLFAIVVILNTFMNKADEKKPALIKAGF